MSFGRTSTPSSLCTKGKLFSRDTSVSLRQIVKHHDQNSADSRMAESPSSIRRQLKVEEVLKIVRREGQCMGLPRTLRTSDGQCMGQEFSGVLYISIGPIGRNVVRRAIINAEENPVGVSEVFADYHSVANYPAHDCLRGDAFSKMLGKLLETQHEGYALASCASPHGNTHMHPHG
eukprot:jgi/Botrbrau1/21430/Bobra.0216s0043.1